MKFIRFCSIPLGALLLPLCLAESSVARDTPLHGVFETSVANTKDYANKFRDVTLEATFTSPSGEQTPFWGFFDGDGTGGPERLDVKNDWVPDSGGEESGTVWKLRFMPTEVGEWTYEWAFSDGSLKGSGSFACVGDGALPGVLRVDERYPRWVRNDEGYFYPTVIEMHWGEQLAYPIEDYRQQYDLYLEKGYNMVGFLWLPIWDFTTWQVNPLNNDGASDPFITVWYQNKPHVEKDRSTYDSDRMLLFAWDRLDQHLGYLAQNEVYAFPFQGFNVKHANEAEVVPQSFDSEKYDWYMRYCMARLAPYYNLMWNNTWESSVGIDGFLAGLERYDPWRHLRMRVEDSEDPRLDVWDSDFSPEEVPVTSDRPFWVTENNNGTGLWGNQDGGIGCCGGTAELPDQRMVLDLSWRYIVRSAPAFILELPYTNYRNPEKHIAPEWSTYAQSKGVDYYAIAHRYVRENLPFWRMSNADERVSGEGALCLAEPGHEYLIYRPSSGQVVLDLTDAAGASFELERLDPFTGEVQKGAKVEGGKKVELQAKGDFLVLRLHRTSDLTR